MAKQRLVTIYSKFKGEFADHSELMNEYIKEGEVVKNMTVAFSTSKSTLASVPNYQHLNKDEVKVVITLLLEVG